jgi:hypothetical protein
MQPDPMDKAPTTEPVRRHRVFSSWPRETRIVVAIATVLVLWVLSSALIGAQIGFGIGLIAAAVVPSYLFSDQLTPAHLPYVASIGLPVLVAGLWLS